ncbi:MAG: ELM1/GtrOC1 family putative glycosyltransferase, partial [Pseudomonadota bacterium]
QDGRPGHDHLSEGVVSALNRLRPRRVVRLPVRRRRQVPVRVLAAGASIIGPANVLRLGYGLAPAHLPAADLVISAGGNTAQANIAAATLLRAENIFCGTVRHAAPTAFSAVVSSYADHAHLPRHVVTIKPSAVDPDAFPHPDSNASSHGPRRPLLIIGGTSGLFTYTQAEWDALAALIAADQTQREGAEKSPPRWSISTSPRTPPEAYAAFAGLQAGGQLHAFVDFRTSGPGTLPPLLAQCDAVLCTADSSSMISEAVAARRPVVGVMPVSHGFKPEEASYRALMEGEGWAAFCALAGLTPAQLRGHWAGLTPMRNNHLDRLAHLLSSHIDVS